MKKKVVISIDDFHEIDGEMENATLSTEGVLSVDKGGYSLVYAELDDSIPGETTLRYDEPSGIVTMTRRGQSVAQLIIEKNKRYSCLYSTEFGQLMLGVYGHEISSCVTEDGGSLNFKYTLDFNTGFSTENELKVRFRYNA